MTCAETVFGASASCSAICRLVQAGRDEPGHLELAGAQRVPRLGGWPAGSTAGEPPGRVGQHGRARRGRVARTSASSIAAASPAAVTSTRPSPGPAAPRCPPRTGALHPPVRRA